jgi:hypothetical protein
MSFTGKPNVGGGELSGQLSGGSIQFGLVNAAGETVSFKGTLAETEIAGTYETSSGDQGVWEGTWTPDPPAMDEVEWPPPGAIVAEPAPVVEDVEPPLSGIRLYKPQPAPTSWKWWGPSWGPFWRLARAIAQTVGANVMVNPVSTDPIDQNEPEVGVDWVNGTDRVIVGANDFSFSGGGNPRPGYYASADGGISWPWSGEIPGLAAYDSGGDPVVEFGPANRAYYSGIAFDNGDVCATDNTVFVATSTNGGQSWSNAVSVVTAPAGSGIGHDKPWLAVNNVPGSPGYSNVYVSWTVFAGGGTCTSSRIHLARSINGGVSFSQIGPVSDNTSGFVQGSSIAVATNGDVVVAWRQGSQIMFDRCTNAGTTCGADQVVATIHPIPIGVGLPGLSPRVRSNPSIAVQTRNSGAATYGFIFLVWAAKRDAGASTDADIWFTWRHFAGSSFATPVAIEPVPQDEFFPALSIDNIGFMNVAYYRRTSQAANTFNTYGTISLTGDVWSAPLKINNGPDIIPVNDFIGDYIGVDCVSRSNIRPVWMDSRLQPIADPPPRNQDIYTAKVSGC